MIGAIPLPPLSLHVVQRKRLHHFTIKIGIPKPTYAKCGCCRVKSDRVTAVTRHTDYANKCVKSSKHHVLIIGKGTRKRN